MTEHGRSNQRPRAGRLTDEEEGRRHTSKQKPSPRRGGLTRRSVRHAQVGHRFETESTQWRMKGNTATAATVTYGSVHAYIHSFTVDKWSETIMTSNSPCKSVQRAWLSPIMRSEAGPTSWGLPLIARLQMV